MEIIMFVIAFVPCT